MTSDLTNNGSNSLFVDLLKDLKDLKEFRDLGLERTLDFFSTTHIWVVAWAGSSSALLPLRSRAIGEGFLAHAEWGGGDGFLKQYEIESGRFLMSHENKLSQSMDHHVEGWSWRSFGHQTATTYPGKTGSGFPSDVDSKMNSTTAPFAPFFLQPSMLLP